jgi:hypothetical protein
MSRNTTFNRLSPGAKVGLIVGAIALMLALANGSLPLGIAGVAALAGVGWTVYSPGRAKAELQPWPLPPDLRELAEALARPIDPTPRRLLPPHEKAAIIAQVATTDEALSRLTADKPPAWPWATFTSVLVQRRNGVAPRLRAVASGYQPHPGPAPLSGRAYSATAYQAMTSVVDIVAQLEQFMRSPAFEGAFGTLSDDADADPAAIISIANRLMDYHDNLLLHAERCLQTPVDAEARVFVQDMGTFTLCPLLGYQKFITTMCTRVGEAQDLLPYTSRGDVVALDDATLTMTLPDGLMDQILAHIARFNE